MISGRGSAVTPHIDGIVIVSHDATRSGASLIALNIAREFARRGIPVVTLLLDAGELEPEFAQLGPLFVLRHPKPLRTLAREPPAWSWGRSIGVAMIAWRADRDRVWRRLLKCIAARGIRHGLCNTVLSGGSAIRLKEARIASIGLIHELPHSIGTYGWTDQTIALVRGTEALVFPCPQIRTAFGAAFSIADKPSFIIPQSPNLDMGAISQEKRAALRSSFRACLKLGDDDVMILGCGTGDFRKGIDLFVHAARQMASAEALPRSGKIVFAWAGNIYWQFRVWAERDVAELGLSDRLLFLGPQRDMAPSYAAADIFFLSSREDPFPTVVLEAMAGGLPVVGFGGTGGFEAQACGGGGILVPYGDVASAVSALRELAGKPDQRDRMGELGRKKIAGFGGYQAYVGRLIEAMTAAC
jgi:O-antigen biosynthesis protein